MLVDVLTVSTKNTVLNLTNNEIEGHRPFYSRTGKDVHACLFFISPFYDFGLITRTKVGHGAFRASFFLEKSPE